MKTTQGTQCKIAVIRHGDYIRPLYTNRPHLTKFGRGQMIRIAELIQDHHLDDTNRILILSSPVGRVIESADAIAETLLQQPELTIVRHDPLEILIPRYPFLNPSRANDAIQKIDEILSTSLIDLVIIVTHYALAPILAKQYSALRGADEWQNARLGDIPKGNGVIIDPKGHVKEINFLHDI